MKYELPKKILEKKIVSAKESADFYEVDATAHPSTSLPIPTTRFQTEFLQLAEQLKEKVGMASARKRVERPKNNTKLDSKGNLIGDVDTEEDGDGEINRIDLKDRAKTVYEGSQKAKRADEEINDNDFVIKNGVLVEYRGTSEDVTIPNSVKEISDYAFNDNNLTNVTIPNSVTKIGSYAFYDNKLTYVDIPDSVTEIGEGAFDKNKLTDVTISNRATIIGDYAFADNKLTSVIIPNSIIRIGNGAFDDDVKIIKQ
jgi:hypothetical protein